MRRPRVVWMTNADDRILEFLQNDPNQSIVATPRVIAENIDFNRGYVTQRLSKLRDHDLVEYYDEGSGIYQITNRGKSYLDGDIDADELEETE